MRHLKKIILCSVFLFSVGAIGVLPTMQAYADYAYPGTLYGRQAFHGYFTNRTQMSDNEDLVNNPMPTGINTVPELMSYLQSLYGGNAKHRTAAALIVHTMLGRNGASGLRTVTSADWNHLRARLDTHASYSGGISWSVNRPSCGVINSWYMPNHNDVSFRVREAGSGKICTDPTIVFRDKSGNIVYELNRRCVNPMGSLSQLITAWDMTGNTTVNGGTSASVLPGETVRFRHSLTNNGPDSTSPSTINWRTITQTGDSVANDNAGTFSNGQTKAPSGSAEDFVVPAGVAPGTQYCRQIRYAPGGSTGGVELSTLRCATVRADFTLQPRINTVIRDSNGQDVSADGVAEAGFTIEFNYSVRNNGLTQSNSTTCTYRQAVHAGFNEAAPTNTFVPAGANCPPNRTFPSNSTTVTAVENVPASAVNTTICRSFTVSPATVSGGSAVIQSCVPVVAKPYSRVFGGDVSVGNGFTTAPGVCATNPNAAAVGWNRRSPGGFAGAGAQYAVMAMAAIRDFSSALGNAGGAPTPSGLAFANSGVSINTGAGLFGGSFGSLPCIPDYYGNMPSDASSALPPVLDAFRSGAYRHSGNLTISGNINPGENVALYVDGDVFINNNISFPGAWSTNNAPNFQLIVRGNIFVGNNVDRIDGLFVAQATSGGSGGIIYTCATSSAPLPLDGSLYGACNRKLTINGAFVANQVRLMRTSGTLSQSNAGDTAPGGGAGGEIFNFSPVLWITQPNWGADDAEDYDAIINLPPIL